MNPVDVYAKLPLREKLEHPLLAAFAVGAKPRARAVIAASVKVCAMVLRFMIESPLVGRSGGPSGSPDTNRVD
jgi:hypothetical protein